jgi:hypothetical protein
MNRDEKSFLTVSMLASIAAQRMREQPGCRTTQSVEIDVTPFGWTLGFVTAKNSNPNDIARGRIIVQRDMKHAYDLVLTREAR